MKPKVLIYIRVSTDEQAQFGYSIDMQKDQCTNFAVKNGFEVLKCYVDDGYTARNMKRPQLQEMLEVLKKYRDIYGVVVWRLDRLCRSTDDYYTNFSSIFKKHNIELLSATENNDMNNPYGRYMRNIQINNAELESNLTSIRTIANMREKAKQGYYPGAIPPIGYKRVKIDKRKHIVLDEEKAPMVQYVLQLYSSGLYTYSQLAQMMREQGLIHNKKPCTKKLIENIVNNNLIFYTGKFNFAGVTYNGLHEPLISAETYLKIKKIQEGNRAVKKQTHTFLYRGLITCPKQGGFMTGETHKGAHNSGTYVYYRCPKRCEICDGCKTMVKQEVIDETVKNVLQSMTITEEQCNQLHDNFKALLKIQSNYDENRKNVISGRITKLRNRIDQLYEDKLDQLITEEVYIKKRDQWQYELDELTLEFSSLSKTNQELIKRLEIMSEPLKDLWGVYSALNDEKKRYLLKLLCPNLFYDGSKVVITIKEPFTALLKFAFFENGAGCGTMSEPNHIINYMKSNEFSILENDIKFCLLQIAA